MKFKNYLMLRIRVKSLLLLNTIIIGTLCVCFTTLNGDEVEDRKDAVEMGKKYRSPYTLPAGVGFVENENDKKKEESFYSNEWKEGEVANSVNGIFQSGKNTMASINGKWIKEGDQAGEEYVLEIRRDAVVLMGKDKETAEIAIQAAMTGHLVFSTLHTNDAPGAVSRLIDMGVEPFLIASSVIGVVAQRLVRSNCTRCTESYVPDGKMLRDIGLKDKIGTTFSKGVGCDHCRNTGYKGRFAIYEILVIDDIIRDLIISRETPHVIAKKAKETQNFRTLLIDGVDKVEKGLTSVEDVLSVATANS
jgi:hypothetical protein